MKDCVLDSGDKWSNEIDHMIYNSSFKALYYEEMTDEEIEEAIGAKTGTMYIDILSAEQVGIIKRRAQELSGLYFILKQ